MQLNYPFRTGKSLARLVEASTKPLRRDCQGMLTDYLTSDSMRVCILHGLRRTGKTTMMIQAIEDLERTEPGSCAYCVLKETHSLTGLEQDLDTLCEEGLKYVFLDEVTAVPEFSDNCGTLADYYAASGMKIVLAGTDSYALVLAEGEELYDRTVDIHTTRITFAEWHHILGGSLDDFIRCGGTLSAVDTSAMNGAFSSWKLSSDYINTAIIGNMTNSLQSARKRGLHRDLGRLSDHRVLGGAILKSVLNSVHDANPALLTRPFKETDLRTSWNMNRPRRGSAPRNEDVYVAFREKTPTQDGVDRRAIDSRLLERFNAHDRENALDGEYTLDDSRVVIDALVDLGAAVRFENRDLSGIVDERFALGQPGIRHAAVVETEAALRLDPYFASLPDDVAQEALKDMRNQAEGRIVEDVAIADTVTYANGSREAFTLTGEARDEEGRKTEFEVDLVVLDPISRECELFEIKRSHVPHDNHSKHLSNPEVIKKVEQAIGHVTDRAVLYNGPSLENPFGNGVRYQNLEEYLSGLPEKYADPRGREHGERSVAAERWLGKGNPEKKATYLPEGHVWKPTGNGILSLLDPSGRPLAAIDTATGEHDTGDGFTSYQWAPNPSETLWQVERDVARELGYEIRVDMRDEEANEMAGRDPNGKEAKDHGVEEEHEG